MEENLKYRLLEILAVFPPRTRHEKRLELRKALGHSGLMMSRYMNATNNETLDFKAMELPIIAEVLGVQIEDLFTKVVAA